jgi:hypothetical protein
LDLTCEISSVCGCKIGLTLLCWCVHSCCGRMDTELSHSSVSILPQQVHCNRRVQRKELRSMNEQYSECSRITSRTRCISLVCAQCQLARKQSVSVARSRCTVVCKCVMAGDGGVDEWLRAVLVVLCAVNILGQVTHVDPVGYTSREGTVCYDSGRPQVLFCMLLYVMYCLDKRHCCMYA